MTQYVIITKLLTSINISNKVFLTLRKMIKYQHTENCIYFTQLYTSQKKEKLLDFYKFERKLIFYLFYRF